MLEALMFLRSKARSFGAKKAKTGRSQFLFLRKTYGFFSPPCCILSEIVGPYTFIIVGESPKDEKISRAPGV